MPSLRNLLDEVVLIFAKCGRMFSFGTCLRITKPPVVLFQSHHFVRNQRSVHYNVNEAGLVSLLPLLTLQHQLNTAYHMSVLIFLEPRIS